MADIPHRFVTVGRIGKTVGLAGDFRYHIDPIYEDLLDDYLKDDDVLFIRLGGCYVPLPVTQVRSDARQIRFAKLHADEADIINGAAIGLPYQASSEDDPSLLIGYTIVAGDDRVGRLDHITEQPSQLLGEVQGDAGKTHLVPLIPDWITAVDHETRTLHMELPEGLLDL